MVGRKNKKPFVAPAGWQKRRKVENPPRYHSSLFPVLETHSTGYHHIPATVTGAPVCIYSISTQPLYSQFGSLIALCLAPTGTSLRGSPCLLLCVIAFCWLHHSKVKTKCQQLFCPRFIFCKSCSRKKSGRFSHFVQNKYAENAPSCPGRIGRSDTQKNRDLGRRDPHFFCADAI